MWTQLARWNPYGLTALMLALATLARASLTPLWGAGYTFISYYPVVMFAAWIGGWRVGLAATAASALLSMALFLPADQLDLPQGVALAFFVAANVIVTFLAEGMHRSKARAEHDVAERARLFAAEQQARAAAEAANRAKDEFIATLAHELRNPLSAILLSTEVLQRVSSEQARTILPALARQAARLQHLVDDLLDVARAASGKLRLERRPMDLLELADTVASAYAERAGTLARIAVSGEPVWIDADAARMTQVLENLLDNAVKYGGAEIGVRVGVEGDRARLSVHDDGQGIEPHLLPRLCEPFFQGAQSLPRAQGGLGLGLALVQRLVALHGGELSAHSDGRGKGSSFSIRLPRASASKPEPPRQDRSANLEKRRVLIIEDEKDSRDSLRLLLELDGHEVAVAENGIEGLAKLQSMLPDIALIDIGLPGIDGYEVARRASVARGRKPVKLVALTGYGDEGARRKAQAAGFDEHVAKPVSYERLRRMLARGAATPR